MMSFYKLFNISFVFALFSSTSLLAMQDPDDLGQGGISRFSSTSTSEEIGTATQEPNLALTQTSSIPNEEAETATQESI